MKKEIKVAVVILIIALCANNCLAQGQITRPTKQTTVPATKPSKTLKPKAPSHKKNSISKATKAAVTVSEPDVTYDGHGCVDLGLPSHRKWATCNIGATTPEGIGTYFAWGEPGSKSAYTEYNSVSFKKNPSGLFQTSNAPCAGTTLNRCLAPKHDAARANWGSSWRMPTRGDFAELIDNCTWQWIESPAGMKVTGPNGKSIFLPASGHYDKFGKSPLTSYWTIETAGNLDETNSARSLHFDKDMYYTTLSSRYLGLNIRPVLR